LHVFPVSFKLDLQCFAGDLATRPAPLCLPSAYEATTSTTGGVGPPHAERGPHVPRVTGACESHAPLFRQGFGGFHVGGVSDGSRGGLGVACVLHAPVTGRFSSSGSFWASVIYAFYHYVYSCLFTVYLCNGL
jgi:hypothetical protein